MCLAVRLARGEIIARRPYAYGQTVILLQAGLKLVYDVDEALKGWTGL